MWEKNASFAKTYAYLLPSSDLHIASIVYVGQFPRRAFIVNTGSVLYILISRRTTIHSNFCIVFLNVLAAVEIMIPQRSLRYFAVTSKCLSEIWILWVIGMSDFPVSMLGLPNSSLFSEDIFLFIRSMLNTISSIISLFSIAPPSYYPWRPFVSICPSSLLRLLVL